MGGVLLAQDSSYCLGGSFGFHQGVVCPQGLLPEPRNKLQRTQLASQRSEWRQPQSSLLPHKYPSLALERGLCFVPVSDPEDPGLCWEHFGLKWV